MSIYSISVFQNSHLSRFNVNPESWILRNTQARIMLLTGFPMNQDTINNNLYSLDAM